MGSAEALGGLVQYRGQHDLEVFEHLAVPETQYRLPCRFKVSRSAIIISQRVEMLRAIKFQPEFGSPARDVQHVESDDKLPGKARPVAG